VSDQYHAPEDFIRILTEQNERLRAANDRLVEENERIRLALEEIIQSADVDDSNDGPAVDAWYCISTHLIDRARAALNIHKGGSE